MGNRKEGIIIGLEHSSRNGNDRNILQKEKYTIGEYKVLKSKNQELNHECKNCREKIRIIIFSEDVAVKEFWRFIIGSISTIIISIFLFQYIRFGIIILILAGMWISSKLINPRAEIDKSKPISQEDKPLTSNEITDQSYDPQVKLEEEQENSNPTTLDKNKKSEHQIIYKIFSI